MKFPSVESYSPG